MQPQSTSPRPRPKQTVIVMMTKFDQRKLKTDLIFYSLYLLVNWMDFILILINLGRYSTPKMFGKSPKGGKGTSDPKKIIVNYLYSKQYILVLNFGKCPKRGGG